MDFLKEGLLKLDPGLLLWTIITFAILLLILWKAAWKPIIHALDARADRIKDSIDKAEKSAAESEELLKKHKQMIATADEEKARIIADARSSAEKVQTEILAKARRAAEEITESSKREILTAKGKALDEIRLEVVNIATDMASKIISKNLKAEDQENIVKDSLDKFDRIQ